MAFKSPETGLVFGLVLALIGGALLGQNRSILNVGNEIVHWILVIGGVLELCLMAFYIGLFFRIQKIDSSNEIWRQDILQMMEKDSSIVRIQGKRMHKTIVLEEFTRSELGTTANSRSGFFSIFPIGFAAASDVPPTTTTENDEHSGHDYDDSAPDHSGEEIMMGYLTSSNSSDMTITNTEHDGPSGHDYNYDDSAPVNSGEEIMMDYLTAKYQIHLQESRENFPAIFAFRNNREEEISTSPAPSMSSPYATSNFYNVVVKRCLLI